jgi:hypothetical protein
LQQIVVRKTQAQPNQKSKDPIEDALSSAGHAKCGKSRIHMTADYKTDRLLAIQWCGAGGSGLRLGEHF